MSLESIVSLAPVHRIGRFLKSRIGQYALGFSILAPFNIACNSPPAGAYVYPDASFDVSMNAYTPDANPDAVIADAPMPDAEKKIDGQSDVLFPDVGVDVYVPDVAADGSVDAYVPDAALYLEMDGPFPDAPVLDTVLPDAQAPDSQGLLPDAQFCVDEDQDDFYGTSNCGTPIDCNDGDYMINPGITDICNSINDDCDEEVDEDVELCEKIVFVSDRNGGDNKDIYAVNVDGSNLKRLTNYWDEAYSPKWSPSGDTIAFLSSMEGITDIYIMKPDGNNLENITNNYDFYISYGSVSWSPDGSRILFSSGGDLVTITPEGTDMFNVTNNPYFGHAPAWSPNGDKIAFTCSNGGSEQICIINPDGTNLRQLTNHIGGEDCERVSWSPDGTKIVYPCRVEDDDDENSFEDIFVTTVAEGIETRLTYTGESSHPSWSPNGSRIAYESEGYAGTGNIYTMNPDGSDPQDITNDSWISTNPVWSADGTRIAFRKYIDGNSEVYIMNADGSGQTNLSNNPASDSNPEWSP